MLLVRVFTKPQHMRQFWLMVIREMVELGLKSMGIIAIISIFMGAVIVLQTAANIESSWIPEYLIGFTARQSVVLEFSPTIIALILAGKVGSSIASEIGTMRVTEQIDALEIMGINSASYLILPKIVAAMFINPFLIVISMFLCMGGGWVIGIAADVMSTQQYVYGLQYAFDPFSVTYALTKTVVFAFIITSVPAYHGYYSAGGSKEVGISSTQGVVYSSIVILVLNYVLTQTMLLG